MKNNPVIISSCIPLSYCASWNQNSEEVQMLGTKKESSEETESKDFKEKVEKEIEKSLNKR